MDIVGKLFNTKNYGEFQVMEKLKEKSKGTNRLYLIKFLLTGYECKKTKYAIVHGSIKDIYYPKKYNVACVGNASKYSSLYDRWHSMIRRCYDIKHKQYHNYGGKGVTVCEK